MTLPLASSRLNSMSARPDLWPLGTDTIGLIQRAGRVRGLDLVDINYPQHTQGVPLTDVKATLAASGLRVGAINLRYEGEFLAGAFTHPDAAIRRKAIDMTRQAGEYALEVGTRQLIVWPGQDGYDYPFQVDYQRVWNHTIEGFQQVCDALPELSIAIEYKPIEPRRFYVLGDMGATLLAISDIGRPNVGVALDFAHSLLAGENPAQAAQMAISRGKLFDIHLNDAFGRADDGLIVGSVHPVQTLELIYTLQQYHYGGHIYFDTFPVREDPVAEAEKNIARLKHFWEMAAALDRDVMTRAQHAQDALSILAALHEREFQSP